MPYLPPGVPASTFAPGVHQVILAEFGTITKPDTLSKLGAKVAYKATFKSLETAAEIDLLIKFNGSKSDYYAGLNIDRLFAVAGLPEPVPGTALDISAMVLALNQKNILIEVNDRGYAQGIVIPESVTTTEEPAF